MKKFLNQIRFTLVVEFEWLRSYPGIAPVMRFIDRRIFGKFHPMISYLILIFNLGFFFPTIGEFLLYYFAFFVPIYQSFLTLRTGTKTDENKWSVYWIIYELMMFFQHLARRWSPPAQWFYLLKVFIFLWLLRPGCRGGLHLVHHYLIRFQQFLNHRRRKVKSKDFSRSSSLLLKSTNHIPLLIGQFYRSGDLSSAIEVLETAGFQIDLVKDETRFVEKLSTKTYRLVWILSSSSIENRQFIRSLTEFHENGGGIFLLADNVPYVAHASTFLLNKFGFIVDGDYQANKTMFHKENANGSIGRFVEHEIFNGVQQLFEGVTISSPMRLSRSKSMNLTTIATGSHAQPCISIFDPPKNSSDGRLCLDCGFTKLFINWNPEETGRYIVNVSHWLARRL